MFWDFISHEKLRLGDTGHIAASVFLRANQVMAEKRLSVSVSLSLSVSVSPSLLLACTAYAARVIPVSLSLSVNI